MKEKIKTEDSIEIWIDGSFENNKTSYAILFDSGKYVRGLLPSMNKQSNNRGELTAFLLAIWMTRESGLNKIYTDSTYVKYVFDKIQQNEMDKESNWDLIEEIKTIILERNKKNQKIEVIHINSHLLDKDKKIKNKEKKISDMKNRLGYEFERILGRNKEVDKLAKEAIKFKEYDGFFINTYGKDWCMKYQKTYYDNINEIKEEFVRQQEKYHNDNYNNNSLNKFKNEEIDWKLNTKLYHSLKFSFHKTQRFNFKLLFNKLKTRDTVNKNVLMRERITDLSKYVSNGCIFCDEIETIEHFLTCKKNINKLKNIPRVILKVINEAGKKFNKKINI